MRGEGETGEELYGVKRIGPKVNLVERCWKGGAVEDVVDGETLSTATRTDISLAKR